MLYSYYPCIKNSIIAKWLMRIHNEAFLSADKCVFIAKNGQDNFLKIYPDYPTKKTALILNGIEDFSVSEVEELKKWNKNMKVLNIDCVQPELLINVKDNVL